jgi:putative ABC transport system ATP-binding protein
MAASFSWMAPPTPSTPLVSLDGRPVSLPVASPAPRLQAQPEARPQPQPQKPQQLPPAPIPERLPVTGPIEPVVNLEARHLLKGFGQGETRTVAVNDVSLQLHRKQLTLLMGPSGSGKSTLLAMISGLLRPDEGQVVAMNEDIWNRSKVEMERFRLKWCSYIFQGCNLFPALTARQQLELILRWGVGLSGRESRDRSQEMLANLGLGKKAHLRPAQLSGGEKQRVAIARALVKEPELLFADEPTSALDWENGESVIKMLNRAAHERGAMVLVVSHDSRLIAYADRVLYMEDGKMTSQGQPHSASDGQPPVLPMKRRVSLAGLLDEATATA